MLWCCCALLVYSTISTTHGASVDINSGSHERCEIPKVKMHSSRTPLQFGTLCGDVVFSLKNRFTSILYPISCKFLKPVLAQREHSLLLFPSYCSSCRQMPRVEVDMYKWCRRQWRIWPTVPSASLRISKLKEWTAKRISPTTITGMMALRSGRL